MIDNPSGPYRCEPLRELGDWIADYRYVPFNATTGTAVRDLVFREGTNRGSQENRSRDCHTRFSNSIVLTPEPRGRRESAPVYP